MKVTPRGSLKYTPAKNVQGNACLFYDTTGEQALLFLQTKVFNKEGCVWIVSLCNTVDEITLRSTILNIVGFLAQYLRSADSDGKILISLPVKIIAKVNPQVMYF